jgi:CrcB protein
MNRFLLIAAGAVLGANARYWVGLWAAGRFGAAFPYGTLIVNVTGCLVLGFLISLSTGRVALAPEVRLLFAVGFLGSYTTFSSFAAESLSLAQDGSLGRSLANLFANNLIGLAATWVGVVLARLIG